MKRKIRDIDNVENINVIGNLVKSDPVVKLNASVLRKIRLLRQYTLQELSELSGLSTSYISRLEAGERRMNTEIIHKLANALACGPEDFFRKDNECHSIVTNGYVKDIPVYRVLSAGASINSPYDVILTNEPMSYTFRLAQFASENDVFVVFGINDNYAPRFKSGDFLYFKRSVCKAGDFAMLVNKDNCLFMGEVISYNNGLIVLEFNGTKSEYSTSLLKEINVLVSVIYNNK